MTILFDGAGFEAEKLCVNQFRGQLLQDTNNQYKDIDCLVQTKKGRKYTASVKDQRTSMMKGYNTIQLELKQYNTKTGHSIDGCFVKNESDYYFWLVWYDNKAQWVIVKSKDLKEYVSKNKDTLKSWTTSPTTEAKNRSYGRKYDRSEGVMISVDVLKTLGKLQDLKSS